MGVGSMNSTPQTRGESLSHSKPSFQFFLGPYGQGVRFPERLERLHLDRR